ncbi:MAG: nucleoside deaminase [Candidatus Saccharibacteria bacterium]|nr:nucleoside deaminase [Candidatus Saccharibacteria bacterium]MDO4967319.1 nucleoside deaminase [Candidatus Saccharibacteria bacterium]
MYRKEFMSLAVAEARIGIKYKHGGPFGAVIVKNGKVIASGHNCVLKEKDSTCHGEISVIRKAEKALNTYDLSGCELYTTAEPCPMCLGAILWANIEKVYYGCSAEDAEVIGFRDKKFEKMFGGYSKKLDSTLEQKDQEMCLEVFEEYEAMEGEVY